jgi:hypothetical protein
VAARVLLATVTVSLLPQPALAQNMATRVLVAVDPEGIPDGAGPMIDNLTRAIARGAATTGAQVATSEAPLSDAALAVGCNVNSPACISKVAAALNLDVIVHARVRAGKEPDQLEITIEATRRDGPPIRTRLSVPADNHSAAGRRIQIATTRLLVGSESRPPSPSARPARDNPGQKTGADSSQPAGTGSRRRAAPDAREHAGAGSRQPAGAASDEPAGARSPRRERPRPSDTTAGGVSDPPAADSAPPPARNASSWSLKRAPGYAWALFGTGAMVVTAGVMASADLAEMQAEIDAAPVDTAEQLANLRALEGRATRRARWANFLLAGGAALTICGSALVAWHVRPGGLERQGRLDAPALSIAPSPVGSGFGIVVQGVSW